MKEPSKFKSVMTVLLSMSRKTGKAMVDNSIIVRSFAGKTDNLIVGHLITYSRELSFETDGQ